jgi:hypothetical protein
VRELPLCLQLFPARRMPVTPQPEPQPRPPRPFRHLPPGRTQKAPLIHDHDRLLPVFAGKTVVIMKKPPAPPGRGRHSGGGGARHNPLIMTATWSPSAPRPVPAGAGGKGYPKMAGLGDLPSPEGFHHGNTRSKP